MQQFLYAHGDVPQPLEQTKRVLDELLTDFITELCFETGRSAQVAGRQKIKLDDVKFACRKNPVYLGKIKEVLEKKTEIEKARKLVDQNDDKIMKSAKVLEEKLGAEDDDPDAMIGVRTIRGKSAATNGR